MEKLFALVMAAGFVAFWIGVIAILWRFVHMVSSMSTVSAIRYTAVSLAVAAAVYLPAALLGAWVFCSPTSPGSCGLGGFVGVGPIVAGAWLLHRARRRN